MEKELADLKEENASMNNLSTKNSSDQMSPEQYLEVLSEEKDLNQMLYFCQLVTEQKIDSYEDVISICNLNI